MAERQIRDGNRKRRREPAGIQVSKAAGTGTKNRTGWEKVSAKESGDDVFGDEDNSFETGDDTPGETEAAGAEETEGSDGEEIRLDQKNGGAEKRKKRKKKKRRKPASKKPVSKRPASGKPVRKRRG